MRRKTQVSFNTAGTNSWPINLWSKIGGAPHAQSKLEDGPVIGGGNEALTEQQENFAEQEDNSLEVEGRENQSYLEQPEVGDGAVGEQEFQVEPHANEVNEVGGLELSSL